MLQACRDLELEGTYFGDGWGVFLYMYAPRACFTWFINSVFSPALSSHIRPETEIEREGDRTEEGREEEEEGPTAGARKQA